MTKPRGTDVGVSTGSTVEIAVAITSPPEVSYLGEVSPRLESGTNRGGTVALVERGQPEAADLPGRSDGEGELGERDRHSIKGGGVGAEFVAAASQVLDERVPGGDDPQRSVCLDPAHGS